MIDAHREMGSNQKILDRLKGETVENSKNDNNMIQINTL
jgi:hypothetical protein